MRHNVKTRCEVGFGGQSSLLMLSTANSKPCTEYQNSFPSPLAEASSMSWNAIMPNWHWRSISL
jgi:hypothetical protein